MITALLSLVTGGTVLLSEREPIQQYAWIGKNRLIACTSKEVIEWPSGRRAPLSQPKGNEHSGDLILSPNGRQAVGNGFVLDLKTLKSTALPSQGSWFWNGRNPARYWRDDDGKWWITHSTGKRKAMAPGWVMQDIEVRDGRLLAYGSKVEPFDWTDTSLLSIDPSTGKARKLATFAKVSDDHVSFGSAHWIPSLNKWLSHQFNRAVGGLYTPRLGNTRIDVPESRFGTTSNHLVPIRGTEWTVLTRTYFGESGSDGYDGDGIGLYNLGTRKLHSVADQINPWKAGIRGETTPLRGTGPSIGNPKVNRARRSLTYVRWTPNGSTLIEVSTGSLF